MADGASELRWAPRVPKRLIRRLYESEAKGLLDEELVDEVGIALYLRCQSILTVNDAAEGRVHCPRCADKGDDTVIGIVSHDKTQPIVCPCCSWQTTWGAFHKTYQGKQLSQGGAGDYFLAYTKAYRRARSAREKMLAIDRVLHEFHYNTLKAVREATRAACVNLIEGKLRDVVPFLNTLSQGASADVRATRQRWLDTLHSMDAWHPKG